MHDDFNVNRSCRLKLCNDEMFTHGQFERQIVWDSLYVILWNSDVSLIWSLHGQLLRGDTPGGSDEMICAV